MAYGASMTIRFIGVGLRKTGEKDGRSYDFVPCCIGFADKNFEGERTVETVVPYATFEALGNVFPGMICDVLYHWYKKRDGSFGLQIDGTC